MKMRVPITGTVKEIMPFISGDNDDPIRMVDVDLGNVSWRLISLDLDNEQMEIEVTPSEVTSEETGEVDEHGKPIFATRPTTAKEKTQLLKHAHGLSLEKMSKQALYALSGSPRLKNPFKKK